LVNLAVNKETVLTERVDAFVIDGREVRLLLMGVFNVHNDKITVWRDYFDLASYQRQLHQA
jgi:limonene-1,2-epoxide hydrolase